MLRVLHHDGQVLAVDKPAGLLSVPGRNGSEPSAWQLARELDPSALPVHRLDRETSGVLLFALGREAHRALNAAFEGRRAEKVYLALLRGVLPAPLQCELPLAEARRGAMRVADGASGEGQPAQTAFAPLEAFAQLTWVEARPRTGRTHQIRVHAAAIGHPLLVDPRYGSGEPVRGRELWTAAPEPDEVVLARTPLHAAALRVPHPAGSGWVQVESPLPPDLSRCLALLRRSRRAG